MEDTKYYSKLTGKLPIGCFFCVQGKKTVVFITGLCPRNCWYCPLSEIKSKHDVIYANEKPIEIKNNNKNIEKNSNNSEWIKEIIEESTLSDSKSCSITGGDPLLVMDRTVSLIKTLKEKFGKHYHIHLYTIPESITKQKLDLLYNVGLDEIRLHPDLYLTNPKTNLEKDIEKIKECFNYNWDIGIEIPIVPNENNKLNNFIELFKKIIYNDNIENIKKHNFFFILNELEYSEIFGEEFEKRNLLCKDDLTYSIEGSEELAIETLKKIELEMPEINVHYCTARLKNGVQLKERLIRRAKKIKYLFEEVTDEGTLIRTCIYLDELKPEEKYHEKIEKLHKSENIEQKNEILKKLKVLYEQLRTEFSLTDRKIFIDKIKFRIIVSKNFVEKNLEKLKNKKYIVAIVEEFPSYDALEIEVDYK